MLRKLTIIVVLVAVYVAVVSRTIDHWNATFPSCHGSKCVVLVTGASRGIGRAIALRLGEAGYSVYAACRKEADFVQYDSVTNVTPVRLDSMNRTNVDEVIRKLPSLYAVVNNAGIGADSVFEFDQTWEAVIDLNLKAHMYITQKLLEQMRRNRQGRIVQIGSIIADIPGPGSAAYIASKSGLRAFADSLRREVRHLGVHVSTIQPGFTTGTDMAFSVLPRFLELRKRCATDSDFADYNKFYDEKAVNSFEMAFNATLGPMEEVTADVLHAIESPRPHNYYSQSILKYMTPIISLLPTGLQDIIF